MYQGILFDLDGTLVDSVPDISRAVAMMCQQLALPAVSAESVRHFVGNGADTLVKRVLYQQFSVTEKSEHPRQAVAMAAFKVAYHQVNGDFAKLYPGVLQTLQWLSPQFECGLVTNKPRQFTVPLLQKLGIDKHFSVVVCGDDLAVKKPEPEPLLLAAKQLNLAPCQLLMVGDSKSDVAAAQRAQIDAFAVNYGYHQGVDLSQWQPKHIASQFSELQHFLGKS